MPAAPELELSISDSEGKVFGTFPCPPGEYLLGRADDCAIPIDLESVAGHHARVQVAADGSVSIEDLGSGSGVVLGDHPVQSAERWHPGEAVRLGKVRIDLRHIWSLDDPVTVAQSEVPRSQPRGTSEEELEDLASTSSGLHLAERRSLDYQLGEEIARGGMGSILRARDNATRRTVAMKLMLTDRSESNTARFIEEAQVTAQLEHPNIVPVHELGVNEHGHPFYTMKMVRGTTLRQVLEQLRKGDPAGVAKYPLAALLTIFQKVCDALAFAHARGVIHRDLKPANIMIARFGEVLVMDWGLAKLLQATRSSKTATASPDQTIVHTDRAEEESDGLRTMAGSLLGTPSYMSPEQARGASNTLDARSDVYSLGTILYEILTLEKAFSARDVSELLEKIVTGDFLPPARRVLQKPASPGESKQAPLHRPHLLRGHVPASLDAVVCKAMALRRDARYASVEALQADLAAYQNGFATLAERAGPWKQLQLFLGRNRKIAAAVLTGLALLALSSGAFTWRVIKEKNRAEAGEKAAREQKDVAERNAESARQQQEIAELNGEAAQLVNVAQTDPEEALLRAMLAVEKSRTLLGSVTPGVQLGLTTALESHRLEATIGYGDGPVAWSGRSRRLAFCINNETWALLDLDTLHRHAQTKLLSFLKATHAALSDDGMHLAVIGDTPTVAIWSAAEQGEGSVSQLELSSEARAMAFLPGSNDLFTVAADGAVNLWTAAGQKREEAWQVPVPGGRIGGCAVQAALRRLAVVAEGTVSTDVFTVEVPAGGGEPRLITLAGHPAKVTAVALSPDGKWVATGDTDGAIRVWSFDGRLVGGPFPAHRGLVVGLTFAPDSNTVASIGGTNSAVWTFQGVLLHGPFSPQYSPRAPALTEDGRMLTPGGGLRIINLLGLENRPPLVAESPLEDIRVAGEGQRLVAIDGQGFLLVWDLATHQPLLQQKILEGRGQYVEVSSDGQWLACSTRSDREICFVGLDGKRVAPSLFLENGDSCQSIAFSPVDRRLAVVTARGRAFLHDPRGLQPVVNLPLDPALVPSQPYLDITPALDRFLVRVSTRKPTPMMEYLWFDWSGRLLSQQTVAHTPDPADPTNNVRRLESYDAGRRLAGVFSRDEIGRWPLTQDFPGRSDVVRIASPVAITKMTFLSVHEFVLTLSGGGQRLYAWPGKPITPLLHRDRFHLDSLVPLGDGRTFISGGGDRRARFWSYGVDAWMQMAAQRLARSKRITQPADAMEKSVSALVSRLLVSAPPPFRPTLAAPLAAAEPPPPVPKEVPAGSIDLPGTPFACALPPGWRLVDPNSVALFNKLFAGLGPRLASRQGEIEVTHAFLPVKGRLRDLFAGGTEQGALLIRFEAASTAADILRLYKRRTNIFGNLQDSQVFASFQPITRESAAPMSQWHEDLQLNSSDIQVLTPAGEKVTFRGYFIMLKLRSYLCLFKSVESGGEMDFTVAEEFLRKLFISPEARPAPELVQEMRRLVEAENAASQAAGSK